MVRGHCGEEGGAGAACCAATRDHFGYKWKNPGGTGTGVPCPYTWHWERIVMRVSRVTSDSALNVVGITLKAADCRTGIGTPGLRGGLGRLSVRDHGAHGGTGLSGANFQRTA